MKIQAWWTLITRIADWKPHTVMTIKDWEFMRQDKSLIKLFRNYGSFLSKGIIMVFFNENQFIWMAKYWWKQTSADRKWESTFMYFVEIMPSLAAISMSNCNSPALNTAMKTWQRLSDVKLCSNSQIEYFNICAAFKGLMFIKIPLHGEFKTKDIYIDETPFGHYM
jgi:hypothetical protein